MAEPAPNLQAIHSRLLGHADKLFEALADLEAAGGLARLAAGMRPSTMEKTANVLKSTRQAIDEQLAGWKAARKGGARG